MSTLFLLILINESLLFYAANIYLKVDFKSCLNKICLNIDKYNIYCHNNSFLYWESVE